VSSPLRGHQLGTILGVWAHPDDETYLSGGLMAEAVRAGQTVACITATRGEAGSSDEVRWPTGPVLAAIRTAELDVALSELGVGDHTWLDYPDGGCAAIDDEEAVARICAVMDRVQPDTVLCFGPDGMTGHDDHRSTSRWATHAVARAGRPRRTDRPGTQIYYATNTPDWLARFRPGLDELGAFMGSEPPCTPTDELAIHARYDGDLLDAKVRALKSQVSQTEAVLKHLGEAFLREGLAEEMFRLP
jgi:LmbE family N-acetylglucosaminyl deacetylase